VSAGGGWWRSVVDRAEQQLSQYQSASPDKSGILRRNIYLLHSTYVHHKTGVSLSLIYQTNGKLINNNSSKYNLQKPKMSKR